MPDPTVRFSSRVDDYRKYRPSYPPQVIGFLEEKCGLSRHSVVADIGCGTGIFAELLLERNYRVFGIEPNREMRAAGTEFLARFDQFEAIDGRAENSGLPNSSVDLVTAAQAFHWFDLVASCQEFKRILKPGGFVAAVWNARRHISSPFLRDYEEMLLKYGIEYEKVLHRGLGIEEMRKFFGHFEVSWGEFEYIQPMTREGLNGRLFSSSYTPVPGHPNYEPMRNRMNEIFERHEQDGLISFEYDTQVYCARLS